MRQESAETFALQALGWLLTQDELLPQFLSASGAAPQDLRDLAQDPVFLGAVLDFLLGDDSLVLGLSAALNCPPEQPLQARMALPGGAGPHWT
ncbi:DUF3572 domain-containing protein [Gemmobacter serpentinus]|uniref:DUF3572 domain-containing protein n=1 Tax=Gemmobacter serpentinus TaxID=2652247 RepID=UPI00124CFE9A|nr:DUF3572 domain-containing protein [Gemmobacter serpentinus]